MIAQMKRHLPWLGAMVLTALLVLAPLWRASGDGIPVHSRFQFDTFSYHYPVMLEFSDAWRHGGELPLWSHFQYSGNPTYADPQTQLWSPITWLVLLTVGYSIVVVQAQVFFIVLLMGLGTYWAGNVIGLPRWAAWAAGAAMMLSGYTTGHATHLGTLASVSFFTIVLAATWLAVTRAETRWQWGAVAGLMLGVCATGGHPTTALVAAYQVLALVVFVGRDRLIVSWKTRGLLLVWIGLISALLAAPMAFGILWGLQVMERVGPGTYTLENAANINPLGMRTLLMNGLLPGMVLMNRAGMGNIGHRNGLDANDITMTPVYMGLGTLLGLAILVAGLRAWRNREATLLGLTLVNLLMAGGMAFSPRIVSYFFLPGMNGPHHASMDFRGFAMLAAVLLGARGLVLGVAMLRQKSIAATYLRRGVTALPVAFALLAIPCMIASVYVFTPTPDPNWLHTRVGVISSMAYLTEELMIQAVMAALFMIPFVIMSRAPRRRPLLAMICLVVATDMSGGFLRTLTVFAERMGPQTWEERIRLEELRELEYKPEQFTNFSTEPRNFPIISRQVSLQAYNPAIPTILVDSFKWSAEMSPTLRAEILANPSRLAGSQNVTAQIVGMSPNSLTIRASSPPGGRLRVMQTWTPDWTMSFNGGPPMDLPRTEGTAFQEFNLLSGNHEIVLRFSPPGVRLAIGLMIAGYLLALGVIAFGLLRQRRSRLSGPRV